MRCFSLAVLLSLLYVSNAAPAASCDSNANTNTTPNVNVNAGTNTTDTGAGATPSGNNVQVFTGSLGGPPPAVINTAGSKRPFSVNGDTFVGSKAALGRSCDVQKNACARAANAKEIDATVGDCDKQNQECKAANGL